MQKSEFQKEALGVLISEFGVGKMVTAATVGMIIRRRFDGPRWKDFGYSSLKELLIAMDRDGLLHVGESEHGALAVAVADGSRRPCGTDAGSAQAQASGTLEKAESLDEDSAVRRPLRSTFWIAFAIDKPDGLRFLNRSTGEVRLGLESAPMPEAEWIEIERIPDDEQRGWARDFIDQKKLATDNQIREAIDSQSWYQDLPTALQTQSADLAKEWNRKRSENVARAVFKWAKEKGVKPEYAFGSSNLKPQLIRSKKKSQPVSSLDENQVRKIALQAISQAPTDWILDIPIPTKYILRALAKNSILC